MLSLQMPKSPLEIVVEIWLECLTVKNSPEKLIYFQSSTGPNLFWAVSLVRPTLYHFNFPNFESHLAKGNQNSGLNLNTVECFDLVGNFASRLMLLRFHLARSTGF